MLEDVDHVEEAVTMTEQEALVGLRKIFKRMNAAGNKICRERLIPFYSYNVPGWAYYAMTDSVEYTGYVVGGH
jgi:hypothetical protein